MLMSKRLDKLEARVTKLEQASNRQGKTIVKVHILIRKLVSIMNFMKDKGVITEEEMKEHFK